jgi:pyruvate dehydrogenase E1 component beta subunit
VTVVAYGRQVVNALAAAEAADADGISAEVIDLRTIRPWDREAVLDSVRRTGRLVTVHDAHRAAGVGAEISATVAENLIYHLDAPIIRVAGFDTLRPNNATEVLGEVTPEWILGGIRRSVGAP